MYTISSIALASVTPHSMPAVAKPMGLTSPAGTIPEIQAVPLIISLLVSTIARLQHVRASVARWGESRAPRPTKACTDLLKPKKLLSE